MFECLGFCISMFRPGMVLNQGQLSFVVSDWESYLASLCCHLSLWVVHFCLVLFTLQDCFGFPFVVLFIQCSVQLLKMNTYPTAFWSDDSSSSDESRYRTTHHKRTKQRGNREQKVLDSWTWKEILDIKGPWAQAGEYR